MQSPLVPVPMRATNDASPALSPLFFLPSHYLPSSPLVSSAFSLSLLRMFELTVDLYSHLRRVGVHLRPSLY